MRKRDPLHEKVLTGKLADELKCAWCPLIEHWDIGNMNSTLVIKVENRMTRREHAMVN